MNRAAKSIYGVGIYLILLGCATFVMPGAVFVRVGLPPPSGIAGSVLGTVILILGSLCLWAARAGWNAFFRWSVHSRCGVLIVFGTYVLVGLAPAALLVFGAVDFLGAVWTAYALRPVGERHAFDIGCHGTGIV